MHNGIYFYEKPQNEPIKAYTHGSPEKIAFKETLAKMKEVKIEIPLIIGGKEIKTGNIEKCVSPYDHSQELATFHKAGEKEVKMAIESSLEAKKLWESFHWSERVAIFRKAAELLSGKWRNTLNAATMLCQSKNIYQAEIDSACELIDFFNFNAWFLTQIYTDQPISPKGYWNRTEYRPLEGFVFAVTPFNFTAIAVNLAASPAMIGNTVVWKPASSSIYSSYYGMKLLQEAGLPDGVINFVPGDGPVVGNIVMDDPNMSGIHFTGSTKTFQTMWKKVGQNIDKYKTYPRIVGETGGKDFVFVHKSAKVDSVVHNLIRGAFEYQGQKCSAASRAYIPDNLWDEIKEKLINTTKEIKVGSPEKFTNFVNAVIDRPSFNKIKSYIDFAKNSEEAEVIVGGNCDDTVGYFIEPTIIFTSNPNFKTMEEEIFGPVLTIYVYENDKFEETLKICNETSPYALTGAIFSQDREAINIANKILYHAAGNFYINDKPTGAVVGQQPFGGSRASGTNDKAGSALNMMRWISVRTVKETFEPIEDYRYPFLEER